MFHTSLRRNLFVGAASALLGVGVAAADHDVNVTVSPPKGPGTVHVTWSIDGVISAHIDIPISNANCDPITAACKRDQIVAGINSMTGHHADPSGPDGLVIRHQSDRVEVKFSPGDTGEAVDKSWASAV